MASESLASAPNVDIKINGADVPDGDFISYIVERDMFQPDMATIVLSNAYHLAQRPGADVVRELGGLHALMGWAGPILTDSGGFQVMSLAGLVKLDDDGAIALEPT